MQPIVTVDLDRIASGIAGQVLLKGRQHAVTSVSAATLQLMRNAKPENYLDVALVTVTRVVPSLGEDDIAALNPAQLEAIIAIATGDVDAVAKLDPNADGPTPAMPSLSPV